MGCERALRRPFAFLRDPGPFYLKLCPCLPLQSTDEAVPDSLSIQQSVTRCTVAVITGGALVAARSCAASIIRHLLPGDPGWDARQVFSRSLSMLRPAPTLMTMLAACTLFQTF